MGLYLGNSDLIGGNQAIQNIEANTNILQLSPVRYFIYETTTFKVPYDTGITIRACGKGGDQYNGNQPNNGYYKNAGGGGGGGYVKDYRQYHKGDIITITFSSGKVSISEPNTALSLVANAGTSGGSSTSGAGGTASGGNLINATGGAGGATGAGSASTLGCGGGGGCATAAGGAGGNGGFSGGSGGHCGYYGYPGGKGGTGNFSGGNGGGGSNNDDYLSDSSRIGAQGGNSPYGIGGKGGYGYNQGTSYIMAPGQGGTGFLAGGDGGDSLGAAVPGGAGGDCTGSTLYGRGGSGSVTGANGSGTEGNLFLTSMPKRVNHGGGNGGVAACIITLGECPYSY